MIIDANMYWLPEVLFTNDTLLQEFLSEMPEEYGWYGYMKEIAGSGLKQIVIEKPKGFQNLNYIQGEYQLEKQLEDLNLAGIDKAVLKLPGCHEWMSLSLCKMFNDGMAEHAGRSNHRLIPLAVVPPFADAENLKELERCKNELGMTGIQLCAHYGDCYLDDKKFDAFFAKLNDLEMTAYIHHTPVPVQYDSLYDYNNLRRSYGRCVDQTTAVGRELFSGMFTRYPKLRFVHSMLGGGFFAFSNMFFPHKAKNTEAVSRFELDNDAILQSFENNIFFEMSHAQPWGKKQMECAIEVLGADHIIFGTSYPVKREWLTEGPEFITSLSITEEEKNMILYENAKKLYQVS
jgi:predicted TIM-barrel fold metal-dependent hydrolase